MKLIDWYLSKFIIKSSLATLLVLTGLSFLIKWADQFRVVGKGSFSLLDSVYWVTLLIPADIELFMPMAILLGTLLGVGSLSANNELTVMQASGLSKTSIILSSLKTVIPLILLTMYISEFVSPHLQLKARQFRSFELSSGTMLHVNNNIWLKDKQYYVHIGKIDAQYRLHNVTLYSFEQQKLKEKIHASLGVYQKDHWRLQDVQITNFSDNKVENLNVSFHAWFSNLVPEKLNIITVQNVSFSIRYLIEHVRYLKANSQDFLDYELMLWKKAFQPLTVAVMLLLALSVIFGSNRHMATGTRIIFGVILGFSFYTLKEIFGNVSVVYGIPPAIGALTPILITLVISIVILRR